MKILVLQGKGYTGKTTALKNLIRMFEDGGYAVKRVVSEAYQGRKRTKQYDEMAVTEVNGVKVGIATGGESSAMLTTVLSELCDGEHCDIIVWPAYTGGETVDFTENINRGKNTVIYYGKTYTSVKKEQAAVNTTQMEYLMGEIKRFCSV